VLSLGLAEAGADVIVNHHDSPDDARDTVAALESLGRRAIAEQAEAMLGGVTSATVVNRFVGWLAQGRR
jgi:NAD(P)-dependent dehydrogenase (short-subunit alcohol dehydrogenase family)